MLQSMHLAGPLFAMDQRPTELLQSFQIGFLDVRRLTELLQRSLNRLASPIALSATATEYGGQLVSAVVDPKIIRVGGVQMLRSC